MAKSNNKLRNHAYNSIFSTATKSSKKIPLIRLSGKWLESAGFSSGQLVHVIVKNGCIILTPKNENLLSFLLEVQ